MLENDENSLNTTGSSQTSAVASTDTYVVNATVSRFTVKAFATGLLSAFGHNPTFSIRDLSGELTFNLQAVEQSSLHLVVQSASLALTDNVSDKDRREIETEMRERVLEVSKFPDIVYNTTNVAMNNSANGQVNVVLNGQLSLHGVTRTQRIPAMLAQTGDMLRANGEFSIRQSDYGIKPVSAVAGGLKVKDEVKLSFDIVARKQG